MINCSTAEKSVSHIFSTAKNYYAKQVEIHEKTKEKIEEEIECLKLDREIKEMQKRKLQIELDHLDPLKKRSVQNTEMSIRKTHIFLQ